MCMHAFLSLKLQEVLLSSIKATSTYLCIEMWCILFRRIVNIILHLPPSFRITMNGGGQLKRIGEPFETFGVCKSTDFLLLNGKRTWESSLVCVCRTVTHPRRQVR